jgi:hypothetical protein
MTIIDLKIAIGLIGNSRLFVSVKCKSELNSLFFQNTQERQFHKKINIVNVKNLGFWPFFNLPCWFKPRLLGRKGTPCNKRSGFIERGWE